RRDCGTDDGGGSQKVVCRVCPHHRTARRGRDTGAYRGSEKHEQAGGAVNPLACFCRTDFNELRAGAPPSGRLADGGSSKRNGFLPPFPLSEKRLHPTVSGASRFLLIFQASA